MPSLSSRRVVRGIRDKRTVWPQTDNIKCVAEGFCKSRKAAAQFRNTELWEKQETGEEGIARLLSEEESYYSAERREQ